IADQMGADPIAVKGWVGEAWVAKRLENIGNEIATLEKEIDGFGAAKTAAQRQYQANRKEKLELLQRVAELRTPEQLAAGLQLYDKLGADNMRALNDMKNTMRKRVLDMLVDTEVMSKEKAETFLENAEWVPFYRVTEEDNSIGGPAVLSKGLSEQMKEKKLKGATGVDDTKQISGVDNLVKWLDWSVRRAVSNQQKRVMVDMFKEHVADEIHEGKGNKGYTISVMENGLEKFYHFDDPLIAEAFTGMLPVMVPGMKAWRSATEGLRKAITRFPLFPAAQVVQDTYDAMFTSGLKHPAKLITEVLREMYRTYKGESTAREALMGRGILSRDYSAAAEQEAAEVLAGLKDQNWWQKVNMNLERFSSTADHVVRQAVYNQAKAEGLSEREALEKATEIINFRRQGSATWVNWMRTMVPFFGAYLQVQNVALKTLSGEGISPTERKAALASLAMTAAKVGLFSMVYSMIMGDDDDYKKMDRRTRDRMILIPGTDVGIAIRPNVFATPKIFAEHAYGYITDNGTTDGAKIRAAAKAALVDSVLPSSYAVPQLVRPALEVAMDHNIFLDRPIVGNLKNLEKAEQFTSSTSELAKLLGASPISPWSPVQWDHLIRGYTSSVGSVLTLATNDAIAAASGRPRPDRSWQDTINSIPNMGNFVTKEFGTGDKTDFYELAGEVEKVNSTVNRLTKQGRVEDVKEYLGDEENKRLYAMKSQVSAIQNNLAKVRAQKNMILQAPESRMNAAQKEVEIRKLNEIEQRMLTNVGKLRKLAGY
ncbi:MAG: LPD38 domain-containing protein, partial [Fluviibacter sp.]